MKTFVTKNGTEITIDGEIVRTPKTSCHISHFYPFEESPDKLSWEATFRRGKRNISEIGLVAMREICIPKDGNTEIVAEISKLADEFRKSAVQAKLSDEKAKADEREKILASCPEGYEVARNSGWLDGICTFKAFDGATCNAWDDAYPDKGQGLYYIPVDRFDSSRKLMADKKTKFEKETSENDAKEKAAFKEAKETGKPIVLRKWITDRCMNGNEKNECSFDSAIESAMPDGSKKTKYVCCF
ncbi:MAG: hypothetical protein WCR96_01685 [Candidatus Methanomethylophilaceae archaeon]